MVHFSLAVIAYNSSATIGETLGALVRLEGLAQVELILVDDASTDDTVERMKAWLIDHGSRFGAVQTVFSPVNRGVSATHTAAFEGATGLWGLYLGGDDLIHEVEFFPRLRQALEHTPGRIYRTRVEEFWSDTGRLMDFYDSYSFVLKLMARRQFRYLASTGHPFRSGPGTVFHIPTVKALDGFGTYNRMYEDWQLFLRFTRAGHRIQFLDVPGLWWRRHATSISSSSNAKMHSYDAMVRRLEVIPYLNRLSMFERWKSRNSGRISRRLDTWYKAYLRWFGRLFRPSVPPEIVAVQLDGQLGNQLFEYLTAWMVAHRKGGAVLADASRVSQPILLEKLSIPVLPLPWKKALIGSDSWRGKAFRSIQSAMPPRWRRVWKEPHYGYWSSLAKASTPAYLSGYWQSYRYFEALPSEEWQRLRGQLFDQLADDPWLEEARSRVVVHVRRGDALNVYGSLSNEYYQNAFSSFPSGTSFLMVSDDLEYCQSHFGGVPGLVFATGTNRSPLLDLRLLSSGLGVVVANSTFSWWGAYLNPRPTLGIVAPRQWIHRGFRTRAPIEDVYPPSWKLL